MNQPTIDALARPASALQDRRTSLTALGAGILAATACLLASTSLVCCQ